MNTRDDLCKRIKVFKMVCDFLVVETCIRILLEHAFVVIGSRSTIKEHTQENDL